MKYSAQEARMKDEDQRADFQKYLTDAVIELWQVFEAEFESYVWSQVDTINMPKGYQEHYMLRLLQDTAGLGACKMMRRVIGLAGVVDIRGIEDPTDKSIAASLALNIGQALIMNRHEVRQIEDIVEIAKGESPTYPWTD
jgi:5-methylthioribose kinase